MQRHRYEGKEGQHDGMQASKPAGSSITSSSMAELSDIQKRVCYETTKLKELANRRGKKISERGRKLQKNLKRKKSILEIEIDNFDLKSLHQLTNMPCRVKYSQSRGAQEAPN